MTRWLKSGGYGCGIRWSDADGCYVGRVTGTGEDVVGFHGDKPEGLVLAFEEAVRDYTATKPSQRL